MHCIGLSAWTVEASQSSVSGAKQRRFKRLALYAASTPSRAATHLVLGVDALPCTPAKNVIGIGSILADSVQLGRTTPLRIRQSWLESISQPSHTLHEAMAFRNATEVLCH